VGILIFSEPVPLSTEELEYHLGSSLGSQSSKTLKTCFLAPFLSGKLSGTYIYISSSPSNCRARIFN